MALMKNYQHCSNSCWRCHLTALINQHCCQLFSASNKLLFFLFFQFERAKI